MGLLTSALVLAVLLGLSAGRWSTYTVAGVVGIAMVALVAKHPRFAAYAYLAIGPLVVGLERGTALPLIRVNELLLAVLWLGLLAGPVRRWAVQGFPPIHLHVVDWCVLALAVFSSVTGLLWMFVRSEPLTLDDILFALTLWKYLALYALVRIAIRQGEHARTALVLALASSAVVALLGILQVLQFGPVPGLLTPFVSADEPEKIEQLNAKSTIGGSIAFADLMAILVAVSLSWFVLVRSSRPVTGVAAAIFAMATLASGQFSGVLGLIAVAITTGALLRILTRLAVLSIPLIVVAAIALRPALEARLLELDPNTGLPVQWTGDTGRLANLQTFIWPRLGEGLNWLLGVQTSARIPAPESYREWIWIESGYTWLLWNGGVPLLLAFMAYVAFAGRACWRTISSTAHPAFRIAAIAALAGLVQLSLLMVVDTHLTMRGTADFLFPLVAMAVTGGMATRGSLTDSTTEPLAAENQIAGEHSSRTRPHA
ncbi:hypothetical protein [Modestobacter sp. VKM Ac-2985]|uniref:hypothetical protein n=1 Tax=Modestobacter sp. VKM Ac-2985 TaxID=3004139 RepID=UPI0022ABB7D5|nr:hypothetical protein [Modestobacter sp. VKM Ac-2985]MCZ2836041.1 hypothetical protein [Modestobacter sp. VKM Ac-2985]